MLCPNCRTKWHAALEARQPGPPINIQQIGTPRPEDMQRQAEKRADDFYARTRAYQEYIERNCAENHKDVQTPVAVFIASRNGGGKRVRRVLWIMPWADAVKVCSDDRTSGKNYMICWTADGLDDPDVNEFVPDNGKHDQVLRDHDVTILDSLAMQQGEAA